MAHVLHRGDKLPPNKVQCVRVSENTSLRPSILHFGRLAFLAVLGLAMSGVSVGLSVYCKDDMAPYLYINRSERTFTDQIEVRGGRLPRTATIKNLTPTYTDALWKSISVPGTKQWVEEVVWAPTTPAWDEWLPEAEEAATVERVQNTTRLNEAGESVEVYSITQAGGSPVGIDGITPNATTNATVHLTLPHARYRANRWHAALLLLITLILQLCVIASLVLAAKSSAPDILGFVSTLTRDEPYTAVPARGSAMDGAERARALAGSKVQLADVRPYDEQGYVAFRSVTDGADPTFGSLGRKRPYQ